MTCHGKYWPYEIIPGALGCEGNLYVYKSIVEKVSAQGKITLTVSFYINEVHCNASYIFFVT